MESFQVRRVGAHELSHLTPGLAEVLVDCVEGGASVSFMAPLAPPKALAFWDEVAEGVARGERALLVGVDGAGAVAGTVQVVLAQRENQPHRADVAKLLVHRRARGRGLATRLMREAEAVARAEGKSVLVLDTQTGSAAERLYARLGWQRAGVIPDYALTPDGALCDASFFYKRL